MATRFKNMGSKKPSGSNRNDPPSRKEATRFKKNRKAAGEMLFRGEDDVADIELVNKIDYKVRDVSYLDKKPRKPTEAQKAAVAEDMVVTTSYDALLQSFQLNNIQEARKAAKKRQREEPSESESEEETRKQSHSKSRKRPLVQPTSDTSSVESEEEDGVSDNVDMDEAMEDEEAGEAELNESDESFEEDSADEQDRRLHEERVLRIQSILDSDAESDADSEEGQGRDASDDRESEEPPAPLTLDGDHYDAHFSKVFTSAEEKSLEKIGAGGQGWSEVEEQDLFEDASVWVDSRGSQELSGVASTKDFGIRPSVVYSWNKLFDDMLKSSLQPSKESTKGPLLTSAQQNLFSLLNTYSDVFYGLRTPLNGLEIMATYTLHVANHLTKALDKIKRDDWEIHDVAVQKRKIKSKMDAIFKAMKKQAAMEKDGQRNPTSEKSSAKSTPTAPSLSNAIPGEEDFRIELPENLLELPREVLKERAKALKATIPDELEMRDQGFTRPKVLVLLPMKNSALEFVELLTKAMPRAMAATVTGRKKFYGEYFDQEYRGRAARPLEWLATFRGNMDDTFRLGISFNGKKMSIYSSFYNSDLIVASPLGLRLAVEENEKGATDYLSSLELVIVDQTDVMLMQNWEHVQWVFDHMSQLPQKTREEINFGRVRSYFLNRQAKHFRQTILLSSLLNVDINALFNRQCLSAFGRYKVRPRNELGSIEKVLSPTGSLKQIFYRLDPPSAQAVDDLRFSYFTAQVWEHVSSGGNTGTLIVIPSYLDYVRVRKFMRDALKVSEINVVDLSEYSSETRSIKYRKHFYRNTAQVLIITERYHFYTRIKIKGIKSLIWYAPPLFPQLYSEVTNWIEEGGSALTIYSRYDSLNLEGIVGRERAEIMLGSEKTTHAISS